MKFYKIIFNDRNYNVSCDTMIMQNGMITFVKNDIIVHAAPKSTLVIETSEDMEQINYINRIRNEYERRKNLAERNISEQGDENASFWRGRYSALSDMTNEFHEILDALKSKIFNL